MGYLSRFIRENLLYKNNYKYFPKTKEKLKAIIKKRIKEEGNEVDLNDIDTSKITNMSSLFRDTGFNGDISKWDVSNVTSMKGMFYGCKKFNSDISQWDVSNVTSMEGMFLNCEVFNQNISKWNVSNVKIASWMFYKCEAFNQDISNWDVSNVNNMAFMFSFCKAFNQDISTWNVSNVKNMAYTFCNCEAFNQDISNWDVSNVSLMLGVFDNCVIEEKYKPKFEETMEDKITIKTENILNAYKSASEEQKKLLKNIFGKEMFKPKDIRERIKTFHDAYCELGNEHPFVKSYEKYVNTASGEEAEVIAYLQLRIISTALNEGWEPQFTKDEHHWYPWFIVLDKDVMKDKCDVEKKFWPFGWNLNKTSNCALSYMNSVVHSNLPASLAVQSEELAAYFGKQFIEIWSDYLLSTCGRKLKFEE